MNKSATPATLTLQNAPPDLGRYIAGFVHRDDAEAGEVVRVLPEVRASIQIMLADPYWLRPAELGGVWGQLPRVALWGPKYAWCYGYARRHIKAYAVGLTAAGLRAIITRPAFNVLDQVLPLDAFNSDLAKLLDPDDGQNFDDWRNSATEALRALFASSPPIIDPVTPALAFLATAETNAVLKGADACGLSERQFRRVFRDYYGVPPKRYQRAVRVDRMIRQIHQAPWETDAFAEAPIPFSDQPHAIREFRAMVGITPHQYVRAKRPGDKTLRSVPVSGMPPPEN